MTKPIEAQWLEIEREHYSLCCDELRELQRGAFFTGAMAAFGVMTGWTPDHPTRVFTISALAVTAIADELTAAFKAAEAAAEVAMSKDLVRH